MLNHRFYILKVCVPSFLIFIPEYLKKELSCGNICPSDYLPIFVVIDRVNEVKPIICLTRQYAIKERNTLRINNNNNKKALISSKLAYQFEIIKDEEVNQLRINFVNGNNEDILTENVKCTFDLLLQSICEYLFENLSHVPDESEALEYLQNTINEINRISGEKNDLSKLLLTSDKLKVKKTKRKIS